MRFSGNISFSYDNCKRFSLKILDKKTSLLSYDNYKKEFKILDKKTSLFSYDDYKIFSFKILEETDIPSLSLHCGVS